jgi:uncharacterized protein (TIGR02444 family)
MAKNEGAAEKFWRFSLMVYARPGIADALIRLQDRDGHNVNLILYGLWLGICEATRLDAAALARAQETTAGLNRNVVAPLRQLRGALRDDPAPDMRALRQRVLALEIAAERCVQTRLAASHVGRRTTAIDRHAIAEANLGLILDADIASDEAMSLRRVIATF